MVSDHDLYVQTMAGVAMCIVVGEKDFGDRDLHGAKMVSNRGLYGGNLGLIPCIVPCKVQF